MTPDRLLKLIDQLFEGNQSEAARFLDYDDRTVRRWLAGELEVPAVVSMLLESMVARGISAARALEYAGRV